MERHVFPHTLVYSKGVPLAKNRPYSTVEEALKYIDEESQGKDKEKLTDLIYGPKRTHSSELRLSRYLEMDKKVLRFDGYFREDTDDWSEEKYRIRRVKVLYYLQNDTMEVIEPKIPNSGLLQGVMFKRQVFPHPKGNGRNYLWKDLNLGIDLKMYGISIRLTDCDQWTKDYMILSGLELNNPELAPSDPREENARNRNIRKEIRSSDLQEDKLYKFLTFDRQVLRFYGTWQDVISDPPEIRKVVLQYYLADDTMELLEEEQPNQGRTRYKVQIRKQKIPLDRNELPSSFAATFSEIRDNEVSFFKPQDFRTGKDVVILGRKVFLYDCDEFTRHFYKTRLGVEDMESIAVVAKPIPPPEKVIPPYTGIGDWEDTLQNCFSLVPKPPKRNSIKRSNFDGITLRFKAKIVTPLEENQECNFVITFYPCDDSFSIYKDAAPNSGHDKGFFLKRSRVMKQSSTGQPVYYGVDDFYIGAMIRASGKVFELIDADCIVEAFMDQNSDLYSGEHIALHRNNLLNSKEY